MWKRRDRAAHKEGHKGLVNVDGQRLGEEVGQIVLTLTPFDDELLAGDPITNPVVLHFDAFCSLGLDRVIGDSLGTPIIR